MIRRHHRAEAPARPDLSVKELAKVIDATPEWLLARLHEAGLPHRSAHDIVSREQKKVLLLSLRQRHEEEYRWMIVDELMHVRVD